MGGRGLVETDDRTLNKSATRLRQSAQGAWVQVLTCAGITC